jgi:predicted O-linked N-acetylglucosamine transferase (SPINDLY family)
MFRLLDRSRFEVFMYAESKDDGSYWRHKVSTTVEHFVEADKMIVS